MAIAYILRYKSAASEQLTVAAIISLFFTGTLQQYIYLFRSDTPSVDDGETGLPFFVTENETALLLHEAAETITYPSPAAV